MLTLLSPAKKLADKTPNTHNTTPLFQEKALQLIHGLKKLNPHEIASLMKLSDKLALLNYDRYQQFAQKPAKEQSHPSGYLFQGDVYQGLDFKSLDEKAIAFGQQHLCILSGLYGLLSPLDAIQPYRLEMGTQLSNPLGKNLYDFWRDTITKSLNEKLQSHTNRFVVNLASNEYFKAVDIKQLRHPVINIDFKEFKQGAYKTIGIHAKKARGTMARFILEQKVDAYEALMTFDELGYGFNEDLSKEAHLVFTRD
jgi:uncharacterized protein